MRVIQSLLGRHWGGGGGGGGGALTFYLQQYDSASDDQCIVTMDTIFILLFKLYAVTITSLLYSQSARDNEMNFLADH